LQCQDISTELEDRGFFFLYLAKLLYQESEALFPDLLELGTYSDSVRDTILTESTTGGVLVRTLGTETRGAFGALTADADLFGLYHLATSLSLLLGHPKTTSIIGFKDQA
jgi:hypothetical protein